MGRWRWYIALGCLALPGLLAAVALAGPGKAIDWTSVAPLSAAARERANREAAGRDAARLLARIVMPAGTVRSAGEPAGDGHALSSPPSFPAGTRQVDRHAWWTVGEPIAAVRNFLRAHVPSGGHLSGFGGGSPPVVVYLTFSFPPMGRVLGIRSLTVTLRAVSGTTTALRADGQVQWIVPRPSAERIPRSVRVLDVAVGPAGEAPSTRATVVNRPKVSRIAALINGLEITQPGAWSCPSWPADAPMVTFTFRRALDGPVVARATELAAATEPTTPCDPMTLTIEGRRWHPLLGGAAVVRTAQRLLGVRLAAVSSGAT